MLIPEPKIKGNHNKGSNIIGRYKDVYKCEICNEDKLCRKCVGYLICRDCDSKINRLINSERDSGIRISGSEAVKRIIENATKESHT